MVNPVYLFKFTIPQDVSYLSYVCQNNKHLELEYLILQGVNIDQIFSNNNTALIDASSYGSPHCLIILINHGADIDAVDRQCNSALMLATQNNHLECQNLLLNVGARVNQEGWNALNCAAIYGRKECAETLIRVWDVNMNIKCLYSNETSLINSVHYYNYEVLKILIDEGADVNSKSSNNTTALMEAVQLKATKIMRWFSSNMVHS